MPEAVFKFLEKSVDGSQNRESLSGATNSEKIAMMFEVPQNLEVTAFHWICQKEDYPNDAPVPYMDSESSTDSEKFSAEDPDRSVS